MRIKPVPGAVIQKFGVKNSAYRLGFHPGTDYIADVGTKAKASEAGVVTYLPSGSAGNTDGKYGNQLKIKLDSGGALYLSHLKSPIVKSGHVITGQAVALTGVTGWTTGPHLHIEWRPTDDIDNPKDFEVWLKKGAKVKPLSRHDISRAIFLDWGRDAKAKELDAYLAQQKGGRDPYELRMAIQNDPQATAWIAKLEKLKGG